MLKKNSTYKGPKGPRFGREALRATEGGPRESPAFRPGEGVNNNNSKTHKQAVLELLLDNQWHTTEEIQLVGGVRSLSRVYELRQEGHTIIRRRDHGTPWGWVFKLSVRADDPDRQLAHRPPKEVLLNLLADGRWHLRPELHDLLGRAYKDHIYLLRKEGFTIAVKQDPETQQHCYKLEL